jgi:ribokinase
LALTDWLVPNESEFEALFGAPPDIDAIAAAAPQRDHGLVVTLGAAGAIVSHRATTTLVPAVPAPAVVDTTGAGDAFVGAFATGLAAGLAPEAAARLGCAAASLSVRQPGTQRSFPSRAAVQRLLITNNREEP